MLGRMVTHLGLAWMVTLRNVQVWLGIAVISSSRKAGWLHCTGHSIDISLNILCTGGEEDNSSAGLELSDSCVYTLIFT